MELVKAAVSMAKDGLSSEESTWCTFANEPQALDFCRTIHGLNPNAMAFVKAARTLYGTVTILGVH